MTETCHCPKHGIAPVSGADCFVCVQENPAFVPDAIDPLHEGSLRSLDRLEFGLDASVEDLAQDIAERIVSSFGNGWTECLCAGVRFATESYVVTALEGHGRRVRRDLLATSNG